MRGEFSTNFPFFMTIAGSVEKSMPGNPHNVYADPSGDGKFPAVLKFEKKSAADEGRQRQAAPLAFAAYTEFSGYSAESRGPGGAKRWKSSVFFGRENEKYGFPGMHIQRVKDAQ